MTDPLTIAAVVLLVALVVAPFVILRRRKRAAALVEIPKPDHWDDRAYAHAHGLTLAQWGKLTPREQAALRASAAHGTNRNAA